MSNTRSHATHVWRAAAALCAKLVVHRERPSGIVQGVALKRTRNPRDARSALAKMQRRVVARRATDVREIRTRRRGYPPRVLEGARPRIRAVGQSRVRVRERRGRDGRLRHERRLREDGRLVEAVRRESAGGAGQGKFALVSIRLPVALTFAALIGGLAAGIAGAMVGAPQGASDIAGLVGGLWLRALQMLSLIHI